MQLAELLRRLTASGFDFVVVGGVATAAHGAVLLTEDLDVFARFNEPNMRRLLLALDDLCPRHRLMSGKPALVEDARALGKLKSLYLTCDLGVLDVLGELPPVPDYHAAVESAAVIDIDGVDCRVLSLDHLISTKQFLGRPKDLHAERMLRVIRERRSRG